MSKMICIPGVQGMAASLIGVLPYAALRLGLYDGEQVASAVVAGVGLGGHHAVAWSACSSALQQINKLCSF